MESARFGGERVYKKKKKKGGGGGGGGGRSMVRFVAWVQDGIDVVPS